MRSDWIIDRLTLSLDNTERAWRRLTAVAHEAVTEGMGTGYGRDEYEVMWRTGDRRHEWTDVVGLYVADQIQEMIDDALHPDEMWRTVLQDILALTDSSTRAALGDHYLPEPDDIEWPDADADEEEE